jgi:hypothetical protein
LAEEFIVFGKIIYDLEKKEITFDSPIAFLKKKERFFDSKQSLNNKKKLFLALAIIPLASYLFYRYY